MSCTPRRPNAVLDLTLTEVFPKLLESRPQGSPGLFRLRDLVQPLAVFPSSFSRLIYLPFSHITYSILGTLPYDYKRPCPSSTLQHLPITFTPHSKPPPPYALSPFTCRLRVSVVDICYDCGCHCRRLTATAAANGTLQRQSSTLPSTLAFAITSATTTTIRFLAPTTTTKLADDHPPNRHFDHDVHYDDHHRRNH